MKKVLALVVAFLAGPTGIAPSWAQAPKMAETVATIPHPGFIENLTETTDGSFYITAAFDKIIWKIGPDRKTERFATFPDQALTLGIAPLNDGFVLAAFKRTFMAPAGVDFSDVGSQVLLLDKAGKITAMIAGEKGAAFNGLIADGHGKYLIADSHLPVIWQFDPATRKIEPWIKSDLLAPPSAADIGGDGLKVIADAVYVSNKSRLSIYRVGLDAGGRPKGSLVLAAANLPAADDFAVAADGTIYIPPAEKAKPGDKTPLTRVSADGKASAFLADAPYGASAIVSRDGKWLYWATAIDGGVADHQQHLMRVMIPELFRSAARLGASPDVTHAAVKTRWNPNHRVLILCGLANEPCHSLFQTDACFASMTSNAVLIRLM